MTHTYNITGMTCGNCIAKAKSQFLMLGDVSDVNVQLTAPQATITMQKHIPTSVLQAALSKAGPYVISDDNTEMHHGGVTHAEGSWLATYKPILLIGAYITGATILVELVDERFDLDRWMRHFMAGFFLTFSFFKLLNLKGFAESYSTYDIVAKNWMGWGYVYPFLELALGICYLINLDPLVVNAATFVIMSISIIGVLETLLRKRKIQCACLGAVFNLPMSTITVIEDALMIGMSGWMLFTMI